MENNPLMKSLGIEAVSLDKQRVVMKMPVDQRTHQPFGYLHGGASVLLAETVASVAGMLNVNLDTHAVFGIEINANHLRSKRDGFVTAIGTPFHIGEKTMVWNIDIVDENEELICISRCTLGVVQRKKH